MLSPLSSPEADMKLLARVDAVLAEMEPEGEAAERPEEQDEAHVEGGLF
jgi:hypothetical protein